MSFKLGLLLIAAFLTRFLNLNWGSGNFFHPDENNMAVSLSQMTDVNFDPHFYAYGQFPMYLGYFILKVFALPNNFANSVLVLRFWSAIFSFFSVGLFYLILKSIFNRHLTYLGSLFFIFTPGLIQDAHFGTTESLLIFIFLANILIAFNILKSPISWRYYFLAAFVNGLGLAAKISALVFLYPVLIVIFASFIKSKHRLHFIPKTFSLILLMTVIFLFLSPYSLINFDNFLSAQKYETSVATGSSQVFYTRQFISTTPYLFQMIKVFPYTSGLFLFIFGLLGFLLLPHTFKKFSHFQRLRWLVILTSSLIYFSYFGQLFTKWTRFVSPIFFIFPLFTTLFISQIKRPLVTFFIVILACFPGCLFLTQYFQPDIRYTASRWIEAHIPPGSTILSEAGNVNNIPITDINYRVDNFDFYNLDSNPVLQSKLPSLIDQAQYILVPSRRIFKNQSSSQFPYSQRYYQHLFDGSLGFFEIKKFSPQTDFLLNPESAEETWSIFDRPTIRIYQKTNQLDIAQYENIFSF